MNEITFQPATAADTTTLLPMMASFYAGFGHAFDTAPTAAALALMLNDQRSGLVWLIRDHQETLGYLVVIPFLSLEYGGMTLLLDELYVAEAARGRGIGSLALDHVAAYARASGIRAVMLEVDHTNPDARRLYERSGYVSVERAVLVRQLAL